MQHTNIIIKYFTYGIKKILLMCIFKIIDQSLFNLKQYYAYYYILYITRELNNLKKCTSY